uniref:Uncharacterized protein n=1 Tax=uncultured Desulfobacterium sp. TaxID=201089 RepID=E1YIN0_9BACT|nr:unknown protein [uncultured Desulfobacterium sp.]
MNNLIVSLIQRFCYIIDGIMSRPPGSEPIGSITKISFEYRLDDQLPL